MIMVNFPVPHLLDLGLSMYQVATVRITAAGQEMQQGMTVGQDFGQELLLGDFWDICLEAQAVTILTMIAMVIMVRGTIGDGLDTVLVGDLAGLGPTTAGPQDPPQVGPQAATTEEAPPIQALGPLQVSVEPSVAEI